MEYRDQMITLADAYGAHVNLSRSRLGTIIMNRGRFFDELLPDATGHRRAVSVDNFIKVKRWFADHWPDQHPWPPGVDRWGLDDPARSPDCGASGPPDPTIEPGSIVAGSAAA